jgi:hypothetical protein
MRHPITYYLKPITYDWVAASRTSDSISSSMHSIQMARNSSYVPPQILVYFENCELDQNLISNGNIEYQMKRKMN